MTMALDELDRRLITLLQANARLATAELARKLGVARTTVLARLQRLEREAVIAGYTVKLGEAARQTRIRATVLLTIEPRAQASVLSRLKSIAEVERVHTTSGRVDFLLQIAAPSTTVLDAVLPGSGGPSVVGGL